MRKSIYELLAMLFAAFGLLYLSPAANVSADESETTGIQTVEASEEASSEVTETAITGDDEADIQAIWNEAINTEIVFEEAAGTDTFNEISAPAAEAVISSETAGTEPAAQAVNSEAVNAPSASSSQYADNTTASLKQGVSEPSAVSVKPADTAVSVRSLPAASAQNDELTRAVAAAAADGDVKPYDPSSKEIREKSILADATETAAAAAAAAAMNPDIAWAETQASYEQTKAMVNLIKAENGLDRIQKALGKLNVEVEKETHHFSYYMSEANNLKRSLDEIIFDADWTGIDISDAADDAEYYADSGDYETAQECADEASAYLAELLAKKADYEAQIDAVIKKILSYQTLVSEVADQYEAAFHESQQELEDDVKPYLSSAVEETGKALVHADHAADLANAKYEARVNAEKEAMLQEGTLLDNLSDILPARISKDAASGVKSLADRAADNARTISQWYRTYSENFRLDSSILNTVLGYKDQIQRIYKEIATDLVDPATGRILSYSVRHQLDQIYAKAASDEKRARDAAKGITTPASSSDEQTPDTEPAGSSESGDDSQSSSSNVQEEMPPAADGSDISAVGENAQAVIDSITEAQDKQQSAADASGKADEKTKDAVSSNENAAIGEGDSAIDNIKDAEGIIADAENAQSLKDAEEAVENAEDAAKDLQDKISQDVIQDSQDAVDDAKEAYDDRLSADTPQAYKEAADRAKAAYDEAKRISDDASAAYEEASKAYDEALAAFETAKEDYEAALTQAQEAAEAGIKNLEDAQEHARLAYEAAQAYLAGASKKAEEAKEKRDKAIRQLAEDWESLKTAVSKLSSAVIGTAAGTVKGVGETALTGIAYSTADLIADYYDVNIEHDEEPIRNIQDSIALEERYLAVELQRRLNDSASSGTDPETIRNMQEKLVELVIRNKHRDADQSIILTKFEYITEIDQFNISANLPEGHKDGRYLSASDEYGHIFYYEVQIGAEPGIITLYPLTFRKELQTQNLMPTAGQAFIKYSSYTPVQDEGFRYIVLDDYVAEEEKNIYITTPIERYDLVAIEYDVPSSNPYTHKDTVYTYVLRSETQDLEETVLSRIRRAVKEEAFDDIPSIKISELVTKYKAYFFDIAVSSEAVLVSDAVDEYELEPRKEDKDKSYSDLIAAYDAVIKEKNDKIAEAGKGIYGDELNRYIQKHLGKLVDDNLDNIAALFSSIFGSRNASQTEEGILDTLTSSIKETGLSSEQLSNGLYDGLGNLVKNVVSGGLAEFAGDTIGSLIHAGSLSSSIQWNLSSLNYTELIRILAEGYSKRVEDLPVIIRMVTEGTFDDKSAKEISDLLQIKIAPNTKRVIADQARKITERLHHDAYQRLKKTVSDGVGSIFSGTVNSVSSAIAIVSDIRTIITSEIDYIIASWFTPRDAVCLVNATEAAYSASGEALEQMRSYRESLGSDRLSELQAQLNAAKDKLDEAEINQAVLNANAEQALDYYNRTLAWQFYQITSGAGQSWKKESAGGASFVFKNLNESETEVTYDHFTGIMIDGHRLGKDSYQVRKGSAIVELRPSYLNGISLGEHTITALFDNGRSVTSVFRISNPAPKPAPSPDRKSSGGQGSQSAGAVVTCQMAGYPNGYVWDENARACRPGFLNASGSFVSSRKPTPNTYDSNGTLFACLMMIALAIASFCGVKLLHEDWEV